MFVLGGLCFLILGKLRNTPFHPLIRLLGGATVITALELTAGFVVNRQHTVWDYSALPCNFRGQICLLYSLLWIPVCAAAMTLYRELERCISQSATFL